LAVYSDDEPVIGCKSTMIIAPPESRADDRKCLGVREIKSLQNGIDYPNAILNKGFYSW
jgi:hypothetical protein